jgi:hypothetical protein
LKALFQLKILKIIGRMANGGLHGMLPKIGFGVSLTDGQRL